MVSAPSRPVSGLTPPDQFGEARGNKSNSEPQSALRGQFSGRNGTPRGASHQAVGMPFVPLIQRRRAGSDQSGSDERLQQQHPVGQATPWVLQTEKVTDTRAHKDEPGNAGLRQCDVMPHQETTAALPAEYSIAGEARFRRTSIASATVAARVNAPTATCSTVNVTMTGIG